MWKEITDDLDALIDTLPPHISKPLYERDDRSELLEVVMDLGRQPEARFLDKEVILRHDDVGEDDIEYVVSRISPFGDDNRAGIERTLHRISAIRNRKGRIVGLTLRVGRAVFGTIKVIEDMVQSGESILLLGRPGVGKTTMLREVARVLAEKKRVVIVDTSNEIAGDGDIPHPAIGHARRMQVPTSSMQHAVMIEAVENHMPEVIVIDEIGTELEAQAARTIAERGVQLVATAHGNTLDNLMMNPTLSDLVGGIQTVTLGDEEARRRGTQKSILERKAPPTFDVVVEIQEWDRVVIHPDVAEIADAILRGRPASAEVRWVDEDGVVRSGREMPSPSIPPRVAINRRSAGGERRLYPFGINRRRLEQAARDLTLPATIVENLDDADALITSRSYYQRKPQRIRDAEDMGIPIYVLRNNTISQMRQCLGSIYSGEGGEGSVGTALREAEDAITRVMAGGEAELSPQNAYIRRLQHRLAEQYNLSSSSKGKEPQRRVRIFKEG